MSSESVDEKFKTKKKEKILYQKVIKKVTRDTKIEFL